ncbi:MAG: carboxypeptidase-like regulatory domain-containing protein, partial [Clostridia bacterium]
MPNISGFVYYDPTFTSIPGVGLANVPIALYNTTTNVGAVALTNSLGAYQFTNVTPGNYLIIETWGTAGLPSPVNFSSALPMAIPPEIEPPISIVPSPPVLADKLNALTPNQLALTVAASDLSNINFYDAPVGNKPLSFSGVSFVGSNLITAADNGTIGSFPAGAAVMTTAPTAPYPSVTPGFTYTTSTIPSDGLYTVMNTRTGSFYPWWPVSDHTTHIETGRSLTVNGANPNAIIFKQNVTVTPNADYVLTAWILNLIDISSGYVPPMLALKVIGSDGSTIFMQNVNPILATAIPVWYQNGFKFNVGSFNNITVEILSEGSAATGNDYLIDDIAMYRASVETLLTVTKTATPPVIFNGSTVTITVNVA